MAPCKAFAEGGRLASVIGDAYADQVTRLTAIGPRTMLARLLYTA